MKHTLALLTALLLAPLAALHAADDATIAGQNRRHPRQPCRLPAECGEALRDSFAAGEGVHDSPAEGHQVDAGLRGRAGRRRE